MRESRSSSWQQTLQRAAGALALGLLIGFIPRGARAICGDGVIDGGPQACLGDCNGDGSVTVDEIVTGVNIALGLSPVSACPQFDGDGSGSVTVDEIITAVNHALTGCPTGAAAGAGSGEECDDGGMCVGGSNAGTPCDSESDCQGDGACFGGANNLRGCDGDEDCPGGTCRRCRPYGGDGCAANCTLETDLTYTFVPGELVGGISIREGTSGSVVNGPIIPVVPLPLNGTQRLTVGKVRDGSAPVVIKAENISIDRIPVSTIACACVRGATSSTCGGTVFDKNGNESVNCTPDFPGAAQCPANLPCAPIHGPGNTGSGFVGCTSGGYDLEVVQDCNGTPGAPPRDPELFVSDTTTPTTGNAYLVISAAIGTVVGSCTGSGPAYGNDGQFCTADDALANRGTPNSIPFTTNSAQGTVLNPADFEGDILGPFGTTGAPFVCSGESVSLSTTLPKTNLAGVFTSCDQPTINDIVVVNNFVAQ